MKMIVKYTALVWAVIILLGLAIVMANLAAEALAYILCGAFEAFMQVIGLLI